MPKSLHSHGGKRKGAGRHSLHGKPMRKMDTRLDDQTIAFYTQQGNGNLSKGIRDYWRKMQRNENPT